MSSDPNTPEPPKPAPVFELYDRATILGLAVMLILSAGIFFLFVGKTGLLDFSPAGTGHGGDTAMDPSEYFLKALDYRERRLALVLTYRTFVTSLGFAVGLILAAIGGIFVLRRARTSFQVGGTFEGAERSSLGFTLATTSPGIAFAAAGVLIMFFTQFNALPVGAPELFPGTAMAVCPKQQLDAETCTINGAETEPDTVQHYCEGNPSDPDCLALMRLRETLGGN